MADRHHVHAVALDHKTLHTVVKYNPGGDESKAVAVRGRQLGMSFVFDTLITLADGDTLTITRVFTPENVDEKQDAVDSNG